jgi:hypothetical protein
MYTNYSYWPTINIKDPSTLNSDLSYHETSLTNCKRQNHKINMRKTKQDFVFSMGIT